MTEVILHPPSFECPFLSVLVRQFPFSFFPQYIRVVIVVESGEVHGQNNTQLASNFYNPTVLWWGSWRILDMLALARPLGRIHQASLQVWKQRRLIIMEFASLYMLLVELGLSPGLPLCAQHILLCRSAFFCLAIVDTWAINDIASCFDCMYMEKS